MLELKNVSFSYKREVAVIQNVSLKIEPGEFLAVAGRNGSGKTTLTRLMMALKKSTAGEILLDGESLKNSGPADMARSIGYVFQNPDRQIFHDSVTAEAAYGPKQLGFTDEEVGKLVNNALTVTGLANLATAYPPSLSRGQKQRLAIASALAMQPRLLILDEPTSGQDAHERIQLMQLLTTLNKQGLAILLITHDMELMASYAHRVIVMDKGSKAFDGSVNDLFKDSRQLQKWGLTEPSALKISRSLAACGIRQTTSVTELTSYLLNTMGRETHASGSATH